MILTPIDIDGKPFHFIGIGGIGMSALAYVLAKRHLPVSGSDTRLSHITQRLADAGVHIFTNQDSKNLDWFRPVELATGVVPIDASAVTGSTVVALEVKSDPTSSYGSNNSGSYYGLPQVICSTAISQTNSEYRAAQELGYPIYHRSDVLAALIQRYRSVAVAGTHGKTTTSSMIGYLMLQAGLDPTIVVGGEVEAWQGNARVGHGDYLVAEADESDGSLAKHAAYIGVVTNIELDHPDHYSTLDEVISVFQTFARQCQTVVGCIDCPTVREYLQPAISYSLHRESGADYAVDQVMYYGDHTEARVWERGVCLGKLSLRLLGKHNLSNALAAVAVGRLLKLDFATIANALSTFMGARRRFEHRGYASGITFVDDYAHHPSEIIATLAAAHQTLEQNRHTGQIPSRLVAIFQPHRYSRTQTFFEEFSVSFADADVVVITDIYGAGEANPRNLSGRQLADAIAVHHPCVHYVQSVVSLPDALPGILQPGDMALFLGAGNVNQAIPELLEFYQDSHRAMLSCA